ncbi:hypothetical protein GEV33_001732 [Tenebrio molitor]|uniref:Uncharacterized protein n=1 Tax=Tenebrio molitor TaxID=7067 RepID=A0A8J6HUR4_TENMO|nr:hypothetical protein GEV33_001732 [Tenebrio molitor]
MTRGSNPTRRLQSATFRGCVGWSGSTCNSPVCSLGCTARPRSSQKKTATPATGEPGLPPNRLSSTYNLLHSVATTGRPYKTRPINGPAKDASPEHPVLRNYTMVSARGFSALVLPTHLVTVSPASTSLIYCTTPGSQIIRLPSLSYSYSPSVPAAKPQCPCLDCGTLKNHPRVKDLSEHKFMSHMFVWKR